MRSRPAIAFAVALLIVLSSAGCSKSPVAPPVSRVSGSAVEPLIAPELGGDDTGGALARGFYPLGLGSHWGFHGETRVQIQEPGKPPGPPEVTTHTVDIDLVCEEMRNGVPYVVERTVTQAPLQVSLAYWVRYRQDPAGLYEADIVVNEPPACAPVAPVAAALVVPTDDGGNTAPAAAPAERFSSVRDPVKRAAFERAFVRLQERAAACDRWRRPGPGRRGGVRDGEITRLRYPLFPGQHWVIRADPLFESREVGLTLVHTPLGPVVAHRVRTIASLFGPNDHVITYYSHRGMLGHRYHLEGNATDDSGNIIGTVTYDDVLTIDAIHLAGGPAH